MIQAPQAQYIPAQYQMPVNYQQQGASQAVQYQQTPGYIYNYPSSSCYTQPNAGASKFNGVNIEIINPQGQGIVPQAAAPVQQAPLMPAQFMPVQQAPVMMPAYPQFPASQAIVQAPAMPQYTPDAAPVVPQPQIATPEQNNVPQAAAPVVEPSTITADASVNPESFAGRLKTTDLDAQRKTIEEVAELVKNDEAKGPILLDTQIFDALVGIINTDTSALEGPTAEISELRNKPQDQLSEAEKQKASTPTPLEKAEINKQYAIYTLAYMQERLNNELEKRNGQALELKDLPCIETVVETVKSNPNPRLRIGAIAALSHVAKPQYKADLQKVFELAQADEDENVKAAAGKALESLK